MPPYLFLIYLFLCLMVALLGCKSRLGFLRSFLFSVILTPFVMTIFLLILAAFGPEKKTTGRMDDARKENA
jgi:hypothetical protein